MPTRTDAQSSALMKLLSILDLEPLELDLFRGLNPDHGWKRVYGGQVLAQALAAATQTVDAARPVHSLHAYFLLAGEPTHPIMYKVERIRDGGSFTTRRVDAIQHGRPIFSMIASFHRPEESLDHQSEMPDVPGPDDVPTLAEMLAALGSAVPDNMRRYYQRERPIDVRVIDTARYQGTIIRPPKQYIWLKANGVLPDLAGIHACILAYASDFALLDTALVAHGKLVFDPHLQMASLDHAFWVHRTFRADDWLLYALDSPNAHGARGFARGSFFTRGGTLVASVAQEGLIRQRTTEFLLK